MRTISRTRTASGRPGGPVGFVTAAAAPIASTTIAYGTPGVSILTLPSNLAQGLAVFIECTGPGAHDGLILAHCQRGGGGGAYANKNASLMAGDVLTVTVGAGSSGDPSKVEAGVILKTALCSAGGASGFSGGQAPLVGDRTFRGGDGAASANVGGGGGGGAATFNGNGAAGQVPGAAGGGAGGAVGGGAGGGSGQAGTKGVSGGGTGGHGFDVTDTWPTVTGSDGFVTIIYKSIGAPRS